MEEINDDERNLIEIIRSFNFLRKYGYHERELSIGHREYPTIIYVNSILKRKVKILGSESSWSIIIERDRFFSLKSESYAIDISNYYNTFGCSMIKGKNYTLKSQAEFVQQHLMPIIKGEIWINELIKQRK